MQNHTTLTQATKASWKHLEEKNKQPNTNPNTAKNPNQPRKQTNQPTKPQNHKPLQAAL